LPSKEKTSDAEDDALDVRAAADPDGVVAGLLDGVTGTLDGIVGGDTAPAPVPEPSGALVMGVAIVTVAIATRKNRR